MTIEIKPIPGNAPVHQFIITEIVGDDLVGDLLDLNARDREAARHRGMLLGKLFSAVIRQTLARTRHMSDREIDELSHEIDARANIAEFPDFYGVSDGKVVKLPKQNR